MRALPVLSDQPKLFCLGVVGQDRHKLQKAQSRVVRERGEQRVDEGLMSMASSCAADAEPCRREIYNDLAYDGAKDDGGEVGNGKECAEQMDRVRASDWRRVESGGDHPADPSNLPCLFL